MNDKTSAPEKSSGPARTRDDSLDEERIVAVARQLIENSGLESVTMRRVAAELGVTAMALYHHVPDKQALLALVADAVISAVPYPESGPWYERLREGLLTTQREIIRYPGLGLHMWGPHGFYPSGYKKLRQTLEVLTEAGFDEEEALDAIYLLTAYEGGYFLMEKGGPQGGRKPTLVTSAESDRLPGVASKADLSSIQVFQRGLDTIISGLRAQLAAKQVLLGSQAAGAEGERGQRRRPASPTRTRQKAPPRAG